MKSPMVSDSYVFSSKLIVIRLSQAPHRIFNRIVSRVLTEDWQVLMADLEVFERMFEKDDFEQN